MPESFLPDEAPAPTVIVPQRAQARPVDRDTPRLPGDWPTLSPAQRDERLLAMASVDSFARFVQAMVKDTVNLEVGRPAVMPDGGSDNREGATPLLEALQRKAWRNARALLDAGANPRATDRWGRHVWAHLLDHPAYEVDEESIIEQAQVLIAAGADVNQQRDDSHARDFGVRDNSALHLAYQHRRYRLVEVLLDAGADPLLRACSNHEPFGWGRSLLHDLMYYHDRSQPADGLRELQRLLDLGLDPNDRASRLGTTPLEVVPALDEVALELIARGGRLGGSRERPSDWFVRVAHRTLVERRPGLLPHLLDLGSPPMDTLKDHDGITPLMGLMKGDFFKSYEDPLPVMEHYLALFPATDLTLCDNKGQGMVHQAAFYGQPGALARLIQQGLPVTTRDADGETPLDELVKGPTLDRSAERFAACAWTLFDAGLTPAVCTAPVGEGSPSALGREALAPLFVAWEQQRLRDVVAGTAGGPARRNRL